MSEHTPDSDHHAPVHRAAAPADQTGHPVFTILACVVAALCWFTPRILLMLPVMAAVGCAAC